MSDSVLQLNSVRDPFCTTACMSTGSWQERGVLNVNPPAPTPVRPFSHPHETTVGFDRLGNKFCLGPT